MKPKNIAILLSTLNGGGAERIAGLLSKELEKIYNVYIFLKNSDNIVYEYGGTIVEAGIDEKGIFYEYAVKKLKKEYHIDVAISFMEAMNFVNIRTRNNEKIILSERSVQSLIDPPACADNERIRRYYDYADAIVSCSEGCKYDLVYNYGVHNKIKTIYNFINKQEILSKSDDNNDFLIKDFLEGEEYYLNIGRLHPQKNQLKLISQYADFHKKHRGIKLVILGSGMLERELNQHIQDLHLEDYAKIVPYTRNPFVYIRHAKALVLSSRYE
ncbi:MAG: glycosyltransferase, partial [Lachnospiraceae bacterium]|nr:glycosyltransferase [Lachnospiraceae bacterium]